MEYKNIIGMSGTGCIMSIAEIVKQLLGLLAGIGVFLISIKIISANLESVGGNKLKALFARTSKSTFLGVGIGTAATALVQSSGATSVMAIGFVNAGIMSLVQACAIVLGASVGTTITGQIVALGFLGGGTTISASVILAGLAGIGAFMMYFAKRDVVKNVGGLLAGFGLLFVGLSKMSGSMEVFAEVDAVKSFIASINFPGYSVVLVLVGIALTAVIQSSSVTSSIAIAMLVSKLISLNQGIYLVLGSNIGSCVVALLACMGSSRKAKCVAIFHLIANTIRVFTFLALVDLMAICTGGTITIGSIFQKMFPHTVPFQLSMFHTIFNAVTVLAICPFIPFLIKLSARFVTRGRSEAQLDDEDEKKDEANRLYYIDDHLLKTPPIAVQQTKNEIINMADIAMRNFDLALDIICTMDYSKLEQFRSNENELNFLNGEITKFVVKLSKFQMSENDHIFLTTSFHSVSDLERIGDYAENIIEYADNLNTAHHTFSSEAINEIRNVKKLIDKLFEKVMDVYIKADRTAYAEAIRIEDCIDDITDQMSINHISRLDAGICTPDVGAQYLSLASNAERVADHLINVANAAKQLF